MDVMDVGQWLVEERAGLDRGEAEWLARLAEFDREGLWSLDGHFSCVTWLVWRLNMGRSTAFEKLRIAHELSRRPIVAQAFHDGRLTYSAVRTLTRLDRPDPEVDEALVSLAQSGQASILDVERAVRSYRLYADQDKPPNDEARRSRDVRIRPGDDGHGQLIATLSNLELQEAAGALQAFLDLRYRPGPVDESPKEDSRPTDSGREEPVDQATHGGKRADAFMDLINSALVGADSGHAAGDDRYMVHVVTRDNGATFSYLDQSPVHPADAGMIGCDAAHITHTVADTGEPLNLGRKTRDWNTAQRRAIGVRDGGHCRFPACPFRHYDIHHMTPWEAGGLTDIANGFCCCRRHHRLLHAAHSVEGDPNGELSFYRPDGTYISSTYPAAVRTLSFSRKAVA
jgi:Domain of unknown function (DUF222)